MCQKYTVEELNSMNYETKNEVIYDMQDRLDKLEHDYENLIEQIRLVNQKRFGHHSKTLDAIAGQLSFFNEAEAWYDEQTPEPAIDDVIAEAAKPSRKPKKKGQSEEGLKDFPQEEICHDVPNEKLESTFGKGNYKSMPDEITWRLRFEPAKWIAENTSLKYMLVPTDFIMMNSYAGIIRPLFLEEVLPRLLWKLLLLTVNM